MTLKRCLEDKIALITGSSRGIGRAIAVNFAQEGAKVVVNYNKNSESAMKVVGEIENSGGIAIAIKADVSKSNEVNDMITGVMNKFGRIDILVNNAGVIKDKYLMIMTEDEWNSVIDTNLKGVFLCSKAVLRSMVGGRYGRIINIVSVSGITGQAGQTNYAASKGGIISFTKSLAREVASFGITVNAIAPGVIKTDMLDSVPTKILDKYMDGIPLRRFGEDKDIAGAAIFLASDASNYMTGQVIAVDGGLSM